MGYPYWISAQNLGSYESGYSLTANPVFLLFAESDNLPCSVHVLNGELPPGTSLIPVSPYQIQLRGELQTDPPGTSWQFTLRASNGVKVADRTFMISATQTVSSFDWITQNTEPLCYVSDNQITVGQIQAQSVPNNLVTYNILNPADLPQGISLDPVSGEISINLAWQSLTAYVAGRDLVFHNQALYVCALSGVSANAPGPQLLGNGVVDSDYQAWQPNTYYELNQVVTNDLGKVYLCVQPGFSANTGGPSGTLSDIADGACVWQFLSQSVVWDQIPVGTQIPISIICAAQVLTNQIQRTFSVHLVSVPHAPIWITPPGLLMTLTPRSLFSYQLQVQEPDNQLIMFTAISLPSWISLSVTGELYGEVPDLSQDTIYYFQINVSDGVNNQLQSFSVSVSTAVIGLTWLTASQLGNISDGVASNLSVQAQTTTSGTYVTYGFTGGILVPGITLNNQTGSLEGFVEHHAQDKTYVFEITAQDAVQRIVRTFELRVVSQQLGHYWTLSVPFFGRERLDVIQFTNQNVVPDDQVYLLNAADWGRTESPQIVLVSGISVPNALQLRELIGNQFRPFDVTLDTLTQVYTPQLPYGSVQVRVQDAESVKLWQPNRSYTQGQTVSLSSGSRLQAQNTGVSGNVEPVGRDTPTQDGTLVWASIPDVNQSVNVNHVLPWYAYHEYNLSDLVTNFGVIYSCAQAGRSGGGLGPQGAHIMVDGDVIWQPSAAFNTSNTFYPASLTSLRSTILQNYSWSSSGQGTGASARCVLDPVNLGIQSVVVTSAGSHYTRAPKVTVIGAGIGAQLISKLGIQSVQVLSSSTGWQVTDQITCPIQPGIPALLEVTAINSFGQVTQMSVLSPGDYNHVSSEPVSIEIGTKRLSLLVNAGVIQIQVIQAGAQHNQNTKISLQGQEWDPIQYTFKNNPTFNVHVCYVNPRMNVSNSVNPYLGMQIPVQYVVAQITGVEPEGITTFDSGVVSWDKQQTQFVEQTPACETVWDQNLTVWDNSTTTWDYQLPQADQFTRTMFDENATLFDYYSTMFDVQPATSVSVTSAQFLWFMGNHVN